MFFQYPPTGSGRCNLPQARALPLVVDSFSTLQPGRVAATGPIIKTSSLSSIFQYPPTASGRCNKRTRPTGVRVDLLSVPSNRVGSLQLVAQIAITRIVRAFQYPPTGSGRCNN